MTKDDRYRWVKPVNQPKRFELVDSVTARNVAVITGVGRLWF